MHDPRDVPGILADELEQLRTSGYDVDGIDPSIGSPAATLEGLRAIGRRPGWPYDEPDDAPAILAALPPAGERDGLAAGGVAGETTLDRIHGAWLGRCAGCILGKPIETWPTDAIHRFLRATDQWPPSDYLMPDRPPRLDLPEFKPSWPRSTRGGVAGAPRDDDLDYTILGLHLIEVHGMSFSTEDAAEELLSHLPFTQIYTAERVAYRNLVTGLQPPATAREGNPYREWIGALIRADVFGLIMPGKPRRAAELALRDARLSHTGNGIYAAMWLAATIAAAVGGAGPVEAVAAGSRQVPPRSRLLAAIGEVLDLRESGIAWEPALARIRRTHQRYSWVHAINNVAAITFAVLWGDGDFGRTIGLAVAAGWDTDSCGATAGSIAGAVNGAGGIPAHWIEPIADRLETALSGFGVVSISDLAERTARLAIASGSDAPA